MHFYKTIPIYTTLSFTGYSNNICLNTGLHFDLKHTILLTPFYPFFIPFVSERKFLSVTARSNIRYQYINKKILQIHVLFFLYKFTIMNLLLGIFNNLNKIIENFTKRA